MSEAFVKKLLQNAGSLDEFEASLNVYSRLILTALIDELKAKGLIKERDIIKRLNAHINEINNGETDSQEVKKMVKKLKSQGEEYIG